MPAGRRRSQEDSSSDISPEEYRALVRRDFGSFIHRAFGELCPRDAYLPNWHLDVLADRLDQVRRGQIKRLIVNLPPRHLKSLAASVALPAFWLGHDPCAQIICASYGQELASKLSRDCRALMQSRFYKQLFAWFRTYEPAEAQAPFERIVQSWDTANKASELADYSVCTTWGVRAKGFYLLHVLRRKLNYPELKRCVAAQQQAFAAQIVLIEDKASGTPLIQELRAAGVHGARAVPVVGDKVMRLHAQTAAIENGFVFLPREAHWLEDYLEELTLFPRGRHDDQVDSTAQALAYLATVESGWLTFARNELEQMKGKAGW